MDLLRKILFPFTALYGAITQIRNYFYDTGFFKSVEFDVPVIVVGNLSVGGTGKTPQIEYLIRLLSDNYRVATLSRGYKRKSKGFVLADKDASAELLGDEPYQFYLKFPKIRVAVDADRVRGIRNLLALGDRPQVILLDDAFQHRRVKPGLTILLTTYGDLYADDFILPTGNLRESRRGAKRADIIVVTKCPPDLSDSEREKIRMRINPADHQQLFYSFINYDESVYSESGSLPLSVVHSQPKVILAGIAKPEYFFKILFRENDRILEFPDHHHFSEKEVLKINEGLDDRIVVTTEKDFVRLRGRFSADKLYYLPIKSEFIENAVTFDKKILDYVGRSTTNSRIH